MQPPSHVLQKRYPRFDWKVYDRSLRTIRTLTHKYIQGSDGSEALYDMQADSGERHDVASSEPARVAELRARLAAWQGTFEPAQSTGEEAELDEDIRRRLSDLGYIED